MCLRPVSYTHLDVYKRHHQDVRTLGAAKLCAIGPKTREALEERGLLVHMMPEEFRAEAIIAALGDKVQPGEKVLLPRADLARPVLVEALQQMGLTVDEVVAYQTVIASEDQSLLLEKMRAGEVHVVTFTSSSTVRNFMTLLQNDMSLIEKMTVACIGPVTADTAAELGIKADIVAEEYTIDGLVKRCV